MRNDGKDYSEITLKTEINKKINSFNKTRVNRIEMAKRYSSYSEKWKFVFLCLNIEAIIFIVLSLTEYNNGIIDKSQFTIASSIFSIYVILLQYYINEFNYSGRALKADYHQLEIEDQILNLKNIMLDINLTSSEDNEMYRVKYNFVLSSYQLALKNNENHSGIDRRRNEYNNQGNNKEIDKEDKNEIKKSTIIAVNKKNEKKGEEDDKEIKRKTGWFIKMIKTTDFSIHNISIFINFLIVIFIFIVLFSGVL